MGAFIVLAISAVIAYFVWPSGVTSEALSQMTFGSLLRVLVAIFVVVGGIRGAITLWES